MNIKTKKNITQETRKIIMSKNQIITTPKGTEIVDVIVGEKGPVSDVKILRKQQDKKL
ncbi:transposase family protein [Okeania sp. KiyG1]|uniref:transposase family protein n=1 Tax=Okeania sp. KiyG1 TaxID=2720165 RepID=UPI0019AA0CD6|nr:transposase family protein [Okeania sp. KiyG1]GFZ96833.1 hypothetical protein CYANOKiyG1_07960 [Okeania sp. KiyG1]GGA32537.1 hypothetical protein CYANOKiyG1_49370 [Okeania sp. KiyG1]